MGKSALTDIIALTGNTDISAKNFAFLDDKHFRDDENKAHHFTATTTWLAGAPRSRRLDEHVPPGTLPLVRYIPQHYFEGLCNETASTGKLQQELPKVIFSHLNSTETLGHATLQALISDRTATADEQIATLRAQLQNANRELLDVERATTTNSINKLEEALKLKEASLDAHLKSEPAPVLPPTTPNSTPALDAANEERRLLENQLATTRDTLSTAREDHAAATDLTARLVQFTQSVERLKADTRTNLARLGTTFDDIVTLTIRTQTITDRRDVLAQQIAEQQQQYDATEAAPQRTNERIATITDERDEPNRLYQRYQRDHETWGRERDTLIGTKNESNSINGLKAQLAHHREALPEQIEKLREHRAAISKAIHEQLLDKAAFQRQLYARIQEELKNNPVLISKLPITFDARLVDQGITGTFNNQINHSRTGKFMDEESISELVRHADINNKESLAATLARIVSDLFDGSDIDNVERQLRKAEGVSVERLYQYLYGLEYLEPQYSLRIKGRQLTQLTPGERGSVLLVFYLLADKDTRPLIIDQPEENLDNQSLYELVAPCIAEAKKRRQIIMVTHNPNIAVVCDAEQIIWCSIAKNGKNKVTYDTGSIENPRMNNHVVNVLEGTWPAFRTREQMYQA